MTEQLESGTADPLITMPGDMQAAVHEARKTQELQDVSRAERAMAQTAAAASEINAARPADMASTLPIKGVEPTYQELTASTVRSPRLDTFQVPPESKTE